jgi:tetratricopeptide (TPR) repeat protein
MTNRNFRLQTYPEFIEAYLARISANNLFKDYQSMLNDYDKVIEIDTKAAIKLGFYGSRSQLKAKMGRGNEALNDMDVLIKSEKDNSGYYIDRGVVREILQDYDGAIKDYEIAFSLTPIKNSFVVKSMIEDANKLLQNKK